jgi:hypothetical protein
MRTRQDLIEFFYPDRVGRHTFWGGWFRFFRPCIPGRLFDKGFIVIKEAINDPEKVPAAVEFLSTSHTKYLSQAGRGEADVECCPTEEARTAVELLTAHYEARNQYQP